MAAQRNATTRNYLRVRGEDGGGSPVQGTPGNYLRVRGEYTQNSSLTNHTWELPPRARRIRHWGGHTASEQGTTSVFSAHAEVVPCRCVALRRHDCILRVRGGSSPDFIIRLATQLYSPRTRR